MYYAGFAMLNDVLYIENIYIDDGVSTCINQCEDFEEVPKWWSSDYAMGDPSALIESA